jgi:hypothetical protein
MALIWLAESSEGSLTQLPLQRSNLLKLSPSQWRPAISRKRKPVSRVGDTNGAPFRKLLPLKARKGGPVYGRDPNVMAALISSPEPFSSAHLLVVPDIAVERLSRHDQWRAAEPEPEFDTTNVLAMFEDLGPRPPSRGRSDDFPGVEIQSVLLAAGGRRTAGKSYRPDPNGRRRAVKVNDYNLGTIILSTCVVIDSLEDVFELIKNISTDGHAFLMRGVLAEWATDYKQHRVTKVPGYAVFRRSVEIHGYGGYFQDVPHQLQMLDLDGVFLPDDMSVVANPKTCILWAVENLLPPEFRETSFVYQLSSSAGLTKQDNELNVHLWFFTNREYWDEDLRAWARWWNAKQHRKIIDPAVFTAVQPH